VGTLKQFCDGAAKRKEREGEEKEHYQLKAIIFILHTIGIEDENTR